MVCLGIRGRGGDGWGGVDFRRRETQGGGILLASSLALMLSLLVLPPHPLPPSSLSISSNEASESTPQRSAARRRRPSAAVGVLRDPQTRSAEDAEGGFQRSVRTAQGRVNVGVSAACRTSR